MRSAGRSSRPILCSRTAWRRAPTAPNVCRITSKRRSRRSNIRVRSSLLRRCRRPRPAKSSAFGCAKRRREEESDGGPAHVSSSTRLAAGQGLANIVTLVQEAGGKASHITRLTWFVLDKQEYLSRLRELGEAYRNVIGKHFPAMTLVQVGALVENEAKLEIEATAVVPD